MSFPSQDPLSAMMPRGDESVRPVAMISLCAMMAGDPLVAADLSEFLSTGKPGGEGGPG